MQPREQALEPLACAALPLRNCRPSTSDARHDAHSMRQAEQQELRGRFERLNCLSSVNDSKLQELQEQNKLPEMEEELDADRGFSDSPDVPAIPYFNPNHGAASRLWPQQPCTERQRHQIYLEPSEPLPSLAALPKARRGCSDPLSHSVPLTRGRRMGNLFYRPPTSTQGNAEPQHLLKTVARKVAEPLLVYLERTLKHTPLKGGRRMNEMFYPPSTRTQSNREPTQLLANSTLLRLPNSRLSPIGNARQQQQWQQHLEQQELLGRSERLNSLSIVIDNKLRELQEQKAKD